MSPARMVRIGIITAAHGVRGHVRILSDSGNPDDVLGHPVLIDSSGRRKFRLTRYGVKDRQLIVAIEGINDRNAAELLKGMELFAVSAAPAPAKKKKANSWTFDELAGLKAQLPNGKLYGEVIAAHNFGAGDIIEITLPGGKTEMLPFTGKFIGDVKPKEGYLVVFPPEYVEAEDK